MSWKTWSSQNKESYSNRESIYPEKSLFLTLLDLKHKEFVLYLSLKVKTSLFSPKHIHLMNLKSISEKDMHIFRIFKWQLQY